MDCKINLFCIDPSEHLKRTLNQVKGKIIFSATLSPSDFLSICPAIVFMHRNKVNKVELNVQAFFNRMIWGGITYRPDVGSGAWFDSNDLTFTVGMEKGRVRFGYAFNLGLGEIAKLSKQSHEVLLSYRLPKKKAKYQRFLEDEE